MNDLEKEQLYRTYYPKAYGYLCHHLNDSHLAEDLCSDTFLKVFSKIDAFDESKASVSTWIFSVTRNTMIDYFRTHHIKDELNEEMMSEENIEDRLCSEETLNELTSALRKMDERKRNVILLHYYSGKTLKEIADQLDISYSYVKILHNAALEELKKKMS